MAEQPYPKGDDPSTPGSVGGNDASRSRDTDLGATRHVPRLAEWGVATMPTTPSELDQATFERLGGNNSFVLIRRVAEGGSGEVWQAVQTSLDRIVAVKRVHEKHYERLKSDGKNALYLEQQFQQEAVVTAHLEHPNIVPVYDLGLDVDGRPLLAMKLVRGQPWDLLLDADFGKLHQDEYLARHLPILISMCQAVAFAHSRRIVHRDLKPSQVMVGEFGEVLLMDWGLALMMDSAPEKGYPAARPLRHLSTPATASNPAGTPSMMAPEQTLESAIGISPLTDVYLLGGTLFYLLTGLYPHEAETNEDSIRHSRQVDVMVPERNVRGHLIARELAHLAERALMRDPAKRPQSVEEFIGRVQDFISGSNRRRESMELCARAAKCIDEVDRHLPEGSTGEESASQTYQELNGCLGLLERALVRWPGNPDVPAMHERVLQRYARLALGEGDLALARVMAMRMEDARVREDVLLQVGRRETQMRSEKRQRRYGLAAAAVLALALLGGTLQYSASMARKSQELEDRGRMLEVANTAAKNAERLALEESQQANAARLQAEREQYFSSVLIAEDAVEEGRVDKALDVLLTKSPPAFRNWEWGHLMARLHPENVLIRGEQDFYHGAFDSTGEKFLLSSNGSMLIVDRSTGQVTREFPVGRGVAWGFDVSPDGKTAAVASFDNRVYLVRLEDGRILHELFGREYQRIACFSPNGELVLTGGADNRFRLFDATFGQLVLESAPLGGHAYAAAWNPDGTRFAVAILDQGVRIFHAGTGEIAGQITDFEASILGIRWTNDGRHLLTASMDRRARLHDAQSLELIREFDNLESWLHDAAISPDGTIVATVDDEGTCRMFDAATGSELGVIQTLGPAFKVEFCPEGRSLLTVSSREARLVDLAQFQQTASRTELTIDEIPTPMADMRIYGVPTHRDRVFGDSERVWNVGSGHSTLSLGETHFLVRSRYAAMDPGGAWLATMDPYGTGAQIRDVPDGALLAEVGVTSLIDLASDPRGRYLALADQQRTIRLVDTSTWTLARELTAPRSAQGEVERPYYLSQIAFSPDGRHLAAAAISDGVLLWDVESGELLQHWLPVSPREEAGLCLAFSPDGRMLASGGSRNIAIIWDVETGLQVSTLAGHGRTLYHLAFSPDGQRVVTSSRDRTVRLWEAASGREVMILEQSEEIPVAAAFSSNGRSLAIAFTNGTGRILDSFPVNMETVEGADELSEADRYELWKRRTRTGQDIDGGMLTSQSAGAVSRAGPSPQHGEAGGERVSNWRE